MTIEWTDAITDEVLDRWIDSFKGYRIPERESVKTPYDKTLIGASITFKRHVMRTGYRLMPCDVPDDDTELLCLQWMEQFSGKSQADIKDIVDLLSLQSPYRQIKYGILGKALYAMKDRYRRRDLSGDLAHRTFWYQDYNPEEGRLAVMNDVVSGNVTSVVHRQIGRYSPGYAYGGSDYGDYEPACLVQNLAQPLYRVSLSWVPEGWVTKHDDYYVFVHPLDVITEDNNA